MSSLAASPSTKAASLHLFCRVVDNFGDIGVCWRLARQIVREHRLPVLLWVDDLVSFQKICAALDVPLLTAGSEQVVDGVTVRHWTDMAFVDYAGPVGDIVVEGFGCRLPDTYIAAMAGAARAPCWINLEYLSAESWVEACHGLPSPHPALALTKYFFFPGFSARTGGLPAERDLAARRDAFVANDAAQAAFLSRLRLARPPDGLLVSLFCYPQAPVAALFEQWGSGAQDIHCAVPEGVAVAAVAAFLGADAAAGATARQGRLRVTVLPFVDQPDYDRLLWACDVNFVRGEDSFLRAQWAARPFVWHIYPQEEGAHLVKLEAFLARYVAGLPAASSAALKAMWRAWNGAAADLPPHWDQTAAVLPQWQSHATKWRTQLLQNGDLASNLLDFAAKHG